MLSRNILKNLLSNHLYTLKQTSDPHVKKLRDFLKTYDNNDDVIYLNHASVAAPSKEEKLKILFDIILGAKPANNTTAANFFNELERDAINSRDYTWEAEVLLTLKSYQKENPSSWFSSYPKDIEDFLKYIDENRSHMQIVKPASGFAFTSEGLKRLLTVYKFIKKHNTKYKNEIERKLFESLKSSIAPYQNLAEGLIFLENNKLYSFYSLELLNVRYIQALDFARALAKISEHGISVNYIQLIKEPAHELKGPELTYEEAGDVLVTLKKEKYLEEIVKLLAENHGYATNYKNFLGVMKTFIKNNLLSKEMLAHLFSDRYFFGMKAANFMKLHKHNILSPENIAIVNINHNKAESLCRILVTLHKANILDDETKDLTNTLPLFSDLNAQSKKVKLFAKANMLTKETFKKIYDEDNEIKKTYNILMSLFAFNIFSQENYELLCQIKSGNDARERAVTLLSALAYGNALTAETREQVIALCEPGVPHCYLSQFISFINTVCELHDEAHLSSTYIMEAFRHKEILGLFQIATLVGRIRNDANIATLALLRDFFDICNAQGRSPGEKITLIENRVNGVIDHREEDLPQEINYGQSVHAKSVEKSVVESLRKLKETYAEIDVEKNYKEIVQFADSLTIENYPNPNVFPKDTIEQKLAADKEWNLKLNTAKSALKKTLPLILTSTEPKTTTSIKKILALVWAAMHDGVKLIGSTAKDEKGQQIPKNIPELIKNALYKFIQHLYEIEGGYALDAEGNHKGGKDISICVGGTINQLIAALDRVHEDVEIVFITRDTMNAKARSLTLELIFECLKTSKLSMTEEGYWGMSWDMTEEVKAYLKDYRFINKEGKTLSLEDHLKEQLTDEFAVLEEDAELLNALATGWQSMPMTLKNQFKPLVNKLVVKHIESAPLQIKQQLVNSLSQDVTLKKAPIPKEIIDYLQSCGFQDELEKELSQFTDFAPSALLTELHDSLWESIRLTKGTLEKIRACSYKRAKDYDELSKQWPSINSLDDYLNAKEKVAFIESLKQYPLPQTPLAALAREELCDQIENSDGDISLREIVEEGSPFLSATLFLKDDNDKIIATSSLLDALSAEDKLFVADKRARDNTSSITLLSEMEETPKKSAEEKRKLREIWRLRGEVEQQFGEFGLYSKKSIFNIDRQRKSLIEGITQMFEDAMEKDRSLNDIKTALEAFGNAAQKHHESISGFRFGGSLFHKTCGFKIAIDKILAKFPIEQEEKHILPSRVEITRDSY